MPPTRLSALPLFLLMAAFLSAPALAQPAAGALDVRWTAGAAECATAPPPLQVHAYDRQTFILRQDPCADFEANFLYLLVGTDRALLIDTGAVADAARMPLADTVQAILRRDGQPMLPLVVAHSHGHLDHRAGDAQFQSLPAVQVVGPGVEDVRAFFGFDAWPGGTAAFDLGGRIVDVLPAPGHHPAQLVFHDRQTRLVFSGDFLLPGRLVVDDIDAYRESAARVAGFFRDRDVAHVLGGHVEFDTAGRLYPRGSTHHPEERALQLSREDLLALPAALDGFNGFYARHDNFVVSNPLHNLAAVAVAALLVLGLASWGALRLLRRRRRRPA